MWLRSSRSQDQQCFRWPSLYVLALGLLLVGCASERSRIIDPNSSDSDAPAPNPHASHTVDLHGNVSDRYDLRITAHYTTFNEDCQRTINTIAGVKSQILVLEELPLARSAGEYRSSVRTDKYVRGYCRWAFYQIIYELWPKGTSQSEPPQWLWTESIGGSAATPSIERKLVCAGTESKTGKIRNWCNYPGDRISYSRPRGGISGRTRTIAVSFE